MARDRPKNVTAYIKAAPTEGQAHLRRLRALLKEIAPDAEEVIKWNTPFFVEPRFLFAFSAHKAHLNFTPNADALAVFSDELKEYKTTQFCLQVRYNEPLPEGVIWKLAEYRVQVVGERDDDQFW